MSVISHTFSIILGVALVAAPLPLLADETRHCNVEVVFRPQNASQSWRSFNFSVHKTVGSLLQVNQARRAARGEAIRCLRDHWAEGLTGVLPPRCEDHGNVDFVGYPFTNVVFQANQALCEANPDVSGNLYFTVELNITGNDGCHFGGTHDPVIIATNQRAICLHAEESEPAPPPPTEEEEAEAPPPIGEGGGWECVGEGCDGSDEAEPEAEAEPEDDGLPATARYLPLPNFRLPGHDLYLVELDAPNWMLCRQACTDDARCGAWTYRPPAGGGGAVCLIKSRAGVPIPDPGFRSGIKQ